MPIKIDSLFEPQSLYRVYYSGESNQHDPRGRNRAYKKICQISIGCLEFAEAHKCFLGLNKLYEWMCLPDELGNDCGVGL